MTNKTLRESALDKLKSLGLSREEVLSLLTDDPEAKDTNPVDRKTWQQLVMEEHMGYYNETHGTSYTFEEYYDDVVNKKIDVHYDWKALLGIMEEK